MSGGTGEEGSKIAFTEILAESAKSWSLVGRLPYARQRLKHAFLMADLQNKNAHL